MRDEARAGSAQAGMASGRARCRSESRPGPAGGDKVGPPGQGGCRSGAGGVDPRDKDRAGPNRDEGRAVAAGWGVRDNAGAGPGPTGRAAGAHGVPMRGDRVRHPGRSFARSRRTRRTSPICRSKCADLLGGLSRGDWCVRKRVERSARYSPLSGSPTKPVCGPDSMERGVRGIHHGSHDLDESATATGRTVAAKVETRSPTRPVASRSWTTRHRWVGSRGRRRTSTR
jgi:hypothetical protein